MSDSTEQGHETAETLHGFPVVQSRGQKVLLVDRASYVQVLKKLADDSFDMCIDLTAVDYWSSIFCR